MRVDAVKTGKSSPAGGPVTDPERREGSVRLDRKHPLAIRWMHWVNFPILFTMIWSGLLIYWNDSDNAYQHPHRVYRIGLGKITLFRFFPDWFYKLLHIPYHVTTGLSYLLCGSSPSTASHGCCTPGCPGSGASFFLSAGAYAMPFRSHWCTCT
jgi:hypothetical protein